MHILISSSYHSIETTKFQALSFHLYHGSTKIKYQIIPESIGDFHTSREGVSFCRRENYVHLLICKMILEKFLIFEAVGGACDHANVKRLYQDLHCHDGVWV